MKLRNSTKIAIGFLVLVVGVWFAYDRISASIVMNTKFPLLKPGRVNLVGIDLVGSQSESSYRIQVSNQIAQLVEAKDAKFEGQDDPATEGGVTAGVDAKRIPVDDMLRAMQGDTVALGNFVAIMNDKTENDDWPARRVRWPAEDIRKALAGDKALESKLVRDLNVNLDGTPTGEIRRGSVFDGIIVDAPVEVKVTVGDELKTLVGRVQLPYRPRLTREVVSQIGTREPTPAILQGFYIQEGKKVLDDPSLREDVRKSLGALVDSKELNRMAEGPERILNRATVVINNDLIKGASYEETDGPQGKKLYDMKISLTDEGVKRLWKYSKNRVGSQLLLTVEGIPIAAPRVGHELAMSELTIKQLPDATLVRDAVELINAHARAN
jgi:hypothetical protein